MRRLVALCLLSLVLFAPTSAQSEMPDITRYNHALRLSLRLPADWIPHASLERGGRINFRHRETGALIEFEPFAHVGTLEAACAEAADRERVIPTEITTLPDERGCVMIGQTNDIRRGLALVRLPNPLVRGTGRFGYLILWASADQITPITESITFPERFSAPQFVAGALDLLQAEYVFTSRVDWDALRAEALTGLADDTDLSVAYDRIETAMRQMGRQGRDNHSQLFRPDIGGRVMPLIGLGARYTRDGTVILVYPGSAAERDGLRVGDRITSINGVRVFDLFTRVEQGLDDGVSLPYTVMIQRDGGSQSLVLSSGGYTDLLPPVINRPTGRLVYIETFGTYGTDISTDAYNRYLTDAHARLSAAAAQEPTCGYILDVRRNLGGVAFPVLLPMMPLVGETLFGTAYRPEGEYVSFGRYDPDQARILGAVTGSSRLRPQDPVVLDTTRPVAILTSAATASMGEFSAVMLLGDPDRPVRMFGEQTAGLASFLGFYTLFDGGSIWIARTLLTDRNGRAYLTGLTPDEPIALDWTRHGTASDPALNAAISWLSRFACS